MNALGLDLATLTGWGSWVDGNLNSGLKSFSLKGQSDGQRYSRFSEWLNKTIQEQPWDIVVYEKVHRHMGTQAAHIYGYFEGELLKLCHDSGIKCKGVGVGSVKKLATGKGNAKKGQMIVAARRAFPDQSIGDDNQADALFILCAGLKFFEGFDLIEEGAGHDQGRLAI